MKKAFLFLFAASCLWTAQAIAEDKTPAPAADAAVSAGGDDYAQRLELAKKMDEIIPASAQIQNALEMFAQKLPERDRESFITRMTAVIDAKKLEQVSIESMAQVFTAHELESMIAYYGSPESKSIDMKMPQYQQRLQPEMMKMIDAALMQLRTGVAAPVPGQ